MDALLSGLMGILGGIISGMVVSILSQRKNEAEIKRLEAETRKINSELETAYANERKEILSKIHELMHEPLGIADFIGRPDRGWSPLNDKSDEYILGFVEDSKLSKFQVQELLKAENKTKFFQEQELWYEFIQLEQKQHEFDDYIVLKEIFLEDEEFIATCKEFGSMMNIFSRSVRDAISVDHDEPAAMVDLMSSLYINAFKPEFDPYEKKIDDYIKSELRPKRNK